MREKILMLQSYLNLSLELLHEDWIQRLPNQDHYRSLCVCNVLDLQVKTLKLFDMGLERTQQ